VPTPALAWQALDADAAGVEVGYVDLKVEWEAAARSTILGM
jgi:hypothetical protein